MSNTEIAEALFSLAEECTGLEGSALFTLSDYVGRTMSQEEQTAVRDAILDAAGRYFHEHGGE